LWVAGNVMDPIHTPRPRPRTPSPSAQAQLSARTQVPRYEFPMTENGRKLLQKYFGSDV
jgi:hypothetical protein